MTFRSPRTYFRDACARAPARTAVRDGQLSLSYQELAIRVDALNEELNAHGIGAGTQVAMVLPNSITFVLWYVSLLELGATLLTLSPQQTARERGQLLDEAGIVWLVSEPALADPGTTQSGWVDVKVGDSERRLRRRHSVEHRIDAEPGNENGVIFRGLSSGSTGRPKHMFRRESESYHNTSAICAVLRLRDAERFLGVTPFFHTFGMTGILCAFFLCGSITIVRRFLPAAVLSAVREDGCTVFFSTPLMLDALSRCRLAPGEDAAMRTVKACLVSTGALSQAVFDVFHARYGLEPVVLYGSVETLTMALDIEPGFAAGRVGFPLSNVEITIVDAADQLCPALTEGFVRVRSPSACQGYVGDPPFAHKTFRDGHIFPGDRGYFDARGCLFLVGRSDIINVGGDKVDRSEVEQVIRALPLVLDVAVDGMEVDGVTRVRAWVEADPDRLSRAAIIAACRANLSAYKVPVKVIILKQFPRNELGKLIKTRLLDALASAP